MPALINVRNVIAALLGAVVVLAIGSIAGYTVCGEGSCQSAKDFVDLIGWDGQAFSLDGTTLELIAALLIFGFTVTMAPRDPVRLLAGIFTVLMAGNGFLMALSPNAKADEPTEVEMADEQPAIELPPIPEPEPLPAFDMQDEDTAACPPGMFREDEGPGDPCVPCEIERRVPAPQTVALTPIRTDAHWVYASDRDVAAAGRSVGVGAFVKRLAAQSELCEAPAIVVLGSASSDGDRQRNRRRARSRAASLAQAVKGACGGNVEVVALSLGQSRHRVDEPADRPIALLQAFPRQDADVTTEAILSELSFAMAEDAADLPLLDRHARFPDPWTDGAGARADISETDRPRVIEVVPAPGAPSSCTQPPSAPDDVVKPTAPLPEDASSSSILPSEEKKAKPTQDEPARPPLPGMVPVRGALPGKPPENH
ncbi:MAG: hypothetical protein AAGG79_01810 [Pseudomonadota bacterium]